MLDNCVVGHRTGHLSFPQLWRKIPMRIHSVCAQHEEKGKHKNLRPEKRNNNNQKKKESRRRTLPLHIAFCHHSLRMLSFGIAFLFFLVSNAHLMPFRNMFGSLANSFLILLLILIIALFLIFISFGASSTPLKAGFICWNIILPSNCCNQNLMSLTAAVSFQKPFANVMLQ